LASTRLKGKKENQKLLSVGGFYSVNEIREMSPIHCLSMKIEEAHRYTVYRQAIVIFKIAQNGKVWRERRESWALTFTWNNLKCFQVAKVIGELDFFS